MIQKDGSILINEWTQGVADSSFLGFASIKDCDIFSEPGVLKIAPRLSPYISGFSATSGTDGFVAHVTGSDSHEYLLYRDTVNGSSLIRDGAIMTTLTGNAWDMVEYKGYLIIATSAGLSCLGTSTTTAFFPLFKTGLTSSYYIKLLVGQDGNLYLTNGNYIAKIAGSTFVAGSSTVAPTCTLTLDALNLKDGEYAVTMVEHGKFLLIGTQGGSSWVERLSRRVANIYPWNRQAGTLGNPGLADLPVKLNENSVQAMISNNNQVYVIAGSRGNIYKTDGTNYTKIKRLPFAQNRPYAVDVRVFPNAVFINNENNLLVGVSEGRGLAGQTDLGVYEVAEKEGYPTVKKYSSPTTPVNIGVVYGDSSDNVYVSWANTTLSGVDYTIGNANASQLASFESPIHLVGDVLRKKTYEHISFQLARPFEDQQAINLYYRIVPTDSYTLIGTFDSDSIGTALSHEVTSGIPEAELLQIKCELVQNDFALTVPRPNLGLLNLHIW